MITSFLPRLLGISEFGRMEGAQVKPLVRRTFFRDIYVCPRPCGSVAELRKPRRNNVGGTATIGVVPPRLHTNQPEGDQRDFLFISLFFYFSFIFLLFHLFCLFLRANL